MKKEIKTSVQINTEPEKVWQILTDFKNYPQWNSFVKSLSGEVKEGNRIKVKLPGMTFSPIVLKFDRNTEFRWLGHLWFKGLFDGEHKFLLVDNSDGTTRFEQSESFSGILVRCISKSLERDTKYGFEKMNEELKQQAENINLRGSGGRC